jgi:enoyl-[acyl-carrier protein] reductase I
MGLLHGRKGIIMGVANEYSLATAIASAAVREGAQVALSHLPDAPDAPGRMARRVQKVAEQIGAAVVAPCDVTSDESIQQFFDTVGPQLGNIDFLVHSVAYAPQEDIQCPVVDASRKGFQVAMDISVYSLLATAKQASKYMERGGSIVTLSYFGGEKVVAGYNLMGLCKAALESATRYLSYDLGPRQIRVNALSAGPVKTLAASAVGDIDQMVKLYEGVSCMQRSIQPEEVGRSALYLLSDLSSAVSGEVHHVDGGYHCMGSPGRLFKI